MATSGPAPYAWPAAAVIVAGTILCELLPVVFGVGYDARFDWGFPYVTLHFVLLPAAAATHILANFAAFVIRRARPLRSRLIDASSVLVPAAYLGWLLGYPFPLVLLFGS